MRRKNQAGKVGLWLAVVGVVTVLAASGGGLFLYSKNQLAPVTTFHPSPITVNVTAGETVDQLSQQLAAAHLIKSSFWFAWDARLEGLKLHPGQFLVDSGMGASAIIAKFAGAADIPTTSLTLVPGWTADQMATQVAKTISGIAKAQYVQEVNSGQFSESFLTMKPSSASLEGFLFADTYTTPLNWTAHQIVDRQLQTFAAKAQSHLQTKTALTPYGVLVLASMVEREAKFQEDRALVAGVLMNRLSIGMALETDSTVLYGLGITGQSPTPDQLKIDTQYNSYLHTGLPPTPIDSPSVASIDAAASPATTGYMYFVSDDCGHMHFSTTFAQHTQAIAQYIGKICSL
jgi:UPF0755 protein